MSGRAGGGGAGGGAGGGGGGGGGGASAGGGSKGQKSSGVQELVDSIKKHKKFRQLASYSVQCLQKVISPPTVGWQAAREEAFESGALDAITEVLTRHKGDPDVLAASTACLTSIASEPKYAGELVRSGALNGMLSSVCENPDAKDGVNETLNLLETVAMHNPEALLAGHGCENVVALLRAASHKPKIASACVRTLERLNRVPGGPRALVASGIVPQLMENVAKPPTEDPEESEMLEATFRLLERMARSTDHADYLRTECDGMQKLSVALEVHRKNDAMCKIGGRLLTKLASGNVEDLIHRMEDPATKPAEKEFLAGLLANLALEDETAAKIVSCGGVPALVRTLESSSAKTVAASARAIARIAADAGNIDELVGSGAVQALVRAIEVDPSVSATITSTLVKFASSAENMEIITEQHGVRTILRALRAHPHDAENALEGLAFIENLPAVDFDLSSIIGEGAIETIVACMRAHPTNKEIQLNGTRSLIYFADSETNATAIARAGGREAVVANLRRQTGDVRKEDENLPLVNASMYLLTSLSLLDDQKMALKASGEVDVMLSAVARYFSRDPAIKELSQEFMSEVVDAEQVAETWSSLEAELSAFIRDKRPEQAKAVLETISRCGAFSILPSNAELIIRTAASGGAAAGGAGGSGGGGAGLGVLVSAISRIASAPGLPRQEAILAACADALFGISDCVSNDEGLRVMLGESGAVEAVITGVKLHPKLKGFVTAAVGFIDSYAQIPECADTIAQQGGIEACVAAIRANQTEKDVVLSSVNTMLRLAATDAGAVAIAKHGGTRQIIQTVQSNTGTPGFREPMEKMLALLQRVAMTTEGAETLVKQGGVDAVIAAVDALSDSARVAQSSSRVLARLLVPEDVEAAVDELNELGRTARGGRVPHAESLKPAISRVGHMSTIGDFASLINRMNGLDSLAAIINVVLSKEDDEATQRDILPAAFQALANLTKNVAPDESLGFDGFIGAAVEKGIATAECLDCIRNLALKSSVAASRLVHDGKTLRMVVDTLRVNSRNKELATACFGALHALASHDETATMVAKSPALRLVQDWIDDNNDFAEPAAIQLSLETLGNMLRSPVYASNLMDDTASLELIKSVLTKHCIDSDKAVPEVLAGTVDVIQRLAAVSPSAIERLGATGVLRRVLRATASHTETIKDPACMNKVLKLITSCSAEPSVREELVSQGSQEMIVAAMNANGTSPDVILAGASALSSLGAGEDAARICLEEVHALVSRIEKSSAVSEEMIDSLGAAVQRLGNFMMIEGIVTRENAGHIMSALSNAVALMAESEVASPEKLAAGVQSIGRIAAMPGDFNFHEAVEMVMDVMSLSEGNKLVRDSAIQTLGAISKHPETVQVISELGCLELIVEAAKADPSDEVLQTLVQDSVRQITRVVNENAAQMVKSEGGAAALASVVAANAADPRALASCVESIAQVAGGEEALWQVLVTSGNSAAGLVTATSGGLGGGVTVGKALAGAATDVTCETLRVLAERHAGSVVVRVPADSSHVQGLAVALGQALAAQAALTATSDTRSRVQALRMAENTLTLLERVELDASGAAMLASNQGVASLSQLLDANLTDDETALRILGIMLNAIRTGNRAVIESCATPDTLRVLVDSLRAHTSNPALVAPTLEVLQTLATVLGPDGSNIDRETMRAVVAAQSANAGDPRVQAAANTILTQLAAKFSDEPAKLMQRSLTAAASTAAAATAIQAVKDESSGRTYYVNKTTGVTTWEAPVELQALKTSISAVAEVASKQAEDAVAVVEADTVRSIAEAMENFATQDADIAQACAQTLTTLSANADNCAAIARSGGIRSILAAIRANPDNLALIRLLLVLLERISRDDEFKETVAREGGIEVVVDIALGRHFALEDVASKALSTLANLAFNSEKNIEHIVRAGGVRGVERAMQVHRLKPRILENATCALSNLMYGSDEIKEVVGQTCGDEITYIVRDHGPADLPLLKMALRALGNLSYLDKNIRFLADEHHATAAIVRGMQAFPDDDELQQISMEVLANFASIEDIPDDPEIQSVQFIIFDEGGTEQIISTIRAKKSNSSIVKSGLDALLNICNDLEVAGAMASSQGLTGVLVEILRELDWDQDLVSHAIPLIAALSESPDAAKSFALQDGVSTIISLMEQHGREVEDVLLHGQLALTNMAIHPEAQTAIRNANAQDNMITLLDRHVDNKLFVAEVMATLTRLCANDDLSTAIGSSGMHVLMRAVDKFRDDAEFLTTAFRLLGHLAFVETNLKAIVQMGGITKIINAIINHPDCQPLMFRSIRTIDNIAMASKENAALVIEEGGKELIQTIMDSYPDDEEIQRSGKSAILSMSALENLTRSAEITAKAARKATTKKDDTPVDPLEGFRQMLTAGKLMSLWQKGSPKSIHLLVSPDFRSIVWQDPKSRTKLGAMDLRSVTIIREGTGEGHKKSLFGPVAEPERCFCISGERSSLDCEVAVKADLKLWLEALQKLFEVFKTNPTAL